MVDSILHEVLIKSKHNKLYDFTADKYLEEPVNDLYMIFSPVVRMIMKLCLEIKRL